LGPAIPLIAIAQSALNFSFALIAIASQTSSETAPYFVSFSFEIFNNEFLSSLLYETILP
jgi:hypothetical protein